LIEVDTTWGPARVPSDQSTRSSCMMTKLLRRINTG